MSGTYSPEDSALVASLVALSAKNSKLVKSTAYGTTIDGAEVKIRSWKMNEFKYYDIPSPFPTLARGLFTRELVTTSSSTLARFLGLHGHLWKLIAVTPTQLVVTSKHSMGAVDPSVQSQSMNHAQAGEGWLRKYLANLGKEEKDMARESWDKNWTAIAELCNDNFEEHVLGYPPEKTGLHLHVRSRHFTTEDPEVVDDFAERWWFIKTPWTSVDTIKEVKTFTNECAARGKWKGEPVEGFVVRTRVTDVPTSGRGRPVGEKGTETDH